MYIKKKNTIIFNKILVKVWSRLPLSEDKWATLDVFPEGEIQLKRDEGHGFQKFRKWHEVLFMREASVEVQVIIKVAMLNAILFPELLLLVVMLFS